MFNGTKVVVIGGSAGSIHVLIEVLPYLNPDSLSSIVIVLHRKAHPESTLSTLLNAYSKVPVLEVVDKMFLEKGKAYLAPADYHLLFEKDGCMSLDVSEKVNFSRPSIDVAFYSAAQVFGENTVGLLLSGANSDGVEGLAHIAQYGGTICVQDPSTAEVDFMPRQALNKLKIEHVLAPKDMACYINKLNDKL
ncbi:chemotaxis protein CheB [Sphingobacterium sp. C459-1T]|uniref:protein-glutamate methylesterase n=2 Tax=Sphingobacterium faecale TaxID=2803775 RepID=A0ABS1R1F6_9SPHI|nr:chemotaxis protein CheB [Sphingobacterium faecale]